MADLNVKTFTRLVQDQVAGIQSRAKALIDFRPGSVLLSFVESTASVALWIQALIIQVLALTRASTSNGTDLDTWMADYTLTRLPAVYSAGSVDFSRFTGTTLSVIPVDAQVQTADGTQSFKVIIDTSNPNWSADDNGYLLPPTILSVSVPVQAIAGGSGGNVQANTVSVMLTDILGVDYVNNPLAMAGGGDAESDDDFRARFVSFIASLSKATREAVGNAVASMQLNLQYTIVEYYQYNGTWDPGYFYVVIDDGSGSVPDQLIADTYAAVDRVRALGIRFSVFRSSVTAVSVSVTITVRAGYTASVVRGEVGDAIETYLTALELGDGVPVSEIYAICWTASAGVANVQSLLVQGVANTDLPADPKLRYIAGAVVVS